MNFTTRESELEFLELQTKQTLLSSHTFNEDKNTVWKLRLTKFNSTGNKNWRLWCERNGEFVHNTEESGKNLSKELRSLFNL
tara:strand:- start:217 stop:462 length:246 start_codon:yes stop_codon:yes gene_type:complete